MRDSFLTGHRSAVPPACLRLTAATAHQDLLWITTYEQWNALAVVLLTSAGLPDGRRTLATLAFKLLNRCQEVPGITCVSIFTTVNATIFPPSSHDSAPVLCSRCRAVFPMQTPCRVSPQVSPLVGLCPRDGKIDSLGGIQSWITVCTSRVLRTTTPHNCSQIAALTGVAIRVLLYST